MITNEAHFVWFGRCFVWAHALAVRSALERGGFEKVILHHADDLQETSGVAMLRNMAGIELCKLNPSEELLKTGDLGESLVELYQRLTSPASRANMIRAAILYNRGGVYLDTDTITLTSFEPLLSAGFFCGTEHIALPDWLFKGYHLIPWIKAGCKLLARDVCRRMPHGWRTFRKIEQFYPVAVNNAVCGARKGHPFVRALLEKMVSIPPARQLVRYALGTHLLQDVVNNHASDDVVIYPPEFFYPLGPEISYHWFQAYSSKLLTEIITRKTVCIHWYGSVRTANIIPKIDQQYIFKNRESQFFSALAYPFNQS